MLWTEVGAFLQGVILHVFRLSDQLATCLITVWCFAHCKLDILSFYFLAGSLLITSNYHQT